MRQSEFNMKNFSMLSHFINMCLLHDPAMQSKAFFRSDPLDSMRTANSVSHTLKPVFATECLINGL